LPATACEIGSRACRRAAVRALGVVAFDTTILLKSLVPSSESATTASVGGLS
jgi:hypothetical protein